MTEEYKQWEYRVQTIGSFFGTKDELIQATLDEWGSEGWEAINVFMPENTGKITMASSHSSSLNSRPAKFSLTIASPHMGLRARFLGPLWGLLWLGMTATTVPPVPFAPKVDGLPSPATRR